MNKTQRIFFGDSELRLQQSGKRWEGIVVGRSNEKFSAASKEALIDLLQKSILESADSFVGLEGAQARFLKLFPEGFTDIGLFRETNDGEIAFKRKMAEDVQRSLPMDGWPDIKDAPEIALRLLRSKTFIDPYTKNDLARVLRGEKARDYLKICTDFALGEIEDASAEFSFTFKGDNVAKWPALTFLPFFWKPESHMFLKPQFTREYASRIGHSFDIYYSPAPNGDTYTRLMDMVKETKDFLSNLNPSDNIDIHSFMWTVVEYQDAKG